MAFPSYPPLKPEEHNDLVPVNVRPMKPLHRPPLRNPLPALPSPSRCPEFTPSYILTTHLYPSAYPHVHAAPLPRSAYADRPNETKEQRKERQLVLLSGIHRTAIEYCDEIRPYEPSREVFWNVVNRFVRKNAGEQKGGVTLFLAHANGFPKETWEPALLELFSHIENTGVIIDEVWAFEAIQHGDSALINDAILGDSFDWTDNARDVLNFLLYHIPSELSQTVLPTHLPRLPDHVAESRKINGYSERTLVAIGHSLGGCTVSRAAFELPTLFSSLILLDPIITPIWATVNRRLPVSQLALPLRASQRRCNWSSREEAALSFKKSPFFSTWNQAVLEKYIQYGLVPDPQAGKDAVMLKMTGIQEAVVFLHRQTSFETWELLANIPAHVEIFIIFNGRDPFTLGGKQASHETAWRRNGNMSNVILPEVGHLIPQEAPEVFGRLAADFLKRKYAIIPKAAL